MDATTLPVAVIGAGPVGLAAAAHLLRRGLTPLVLEAGDRVGAAIRRWGHVRVFSPWRYDVDAAAAALLAESGWTMPDPDHLPTGTEIVTEYLEPLAALPAIRRHVRLGTRVVSVSRRGCDKLRTEGRETTPFVLRVRVAGGEEQEILARAVIDASGTYGTPNPLGADGTPARGEAGAADRVFYGIPDVLGADRPRYAGRHIAVVGSGHSALNTLIDLADLAQTAPGTRVTWIVRRPPPARVFGGGAADALPARGALGERTRALLDGGAIALVVGRVASVSRTPDGVTLRDDAGRLLGAVDEVVAVTGFRPDLGPLGELRLDLDPIMEAPRTLAPLIDPNLHSCGTVPPHGVTELGHAEPGFYIAGMKSYGRAPTFLLLTGYEQVRSIAAALAGDWDAARDVQLTLPETGVCSSAGVAETVASACCAPTGCGPETTPARAPERLVLIAAPAGGAGGAGGCCRG